MDSVLGNAAKPLVSIITPVFNADTCIRECLESVGKQNYPFFEHIIVDGGSTDRTMQIVQDYAQSHKHVRYISEKDRGLYDAMNKGIALALGEWLLFLGSDDQLYKDETLSSVFSGDQLRQHDVLYGKVIYKNAGTYYGEAYDKEKIFQQNICHQAIFTKRKVFAEIGEFDIRFKVFADWDINLKLFLNDSLSKHYINQVIAVYREEGLSSWQSDKEFFRNWPQVKNPFLHPDTKMEANHNIGKYGFSQLQSGKVTSGLSALWTAAFRTKEYRYYIKNGFYWLAKRWKII